MLSLAPFWFVMSTCASADSHETANPLYRELRDNGAQISNKEKAKLPAPSLADGLSAREQFKVIQDIAGNEYEVDDLVRNSVVAPFVLRIRDVKPADPQAPARGVDLWFVVHASLDIELDDKFAERAFGENRKDSKGKALTPDDLSKRGITLAADAKNESFGHVIFTFLDRVQIEATGRSYWSKTRDSVVAAAQLDPRFGEDKEFPNRWRSIEKDGDSVKTGPWRPYSGAAQYLKATRLAEPKGAVFVEFHLVFTEPVGWFDGENFLRSKLPPASQQLIRSMRRELLKEMKK